MEYLRRQWDQPTRSDNYLMQIAFFCARQNLKNPNRVKFNDMRLKFGGVSSHKGRPLTTSQKKMITDQTKSLWISRVVLPGKQLTHKTTEHLG